MAFRLNSNQLPNFCEVAGGDGLPAPDTGVPADPIMSQEAKDASADDAALDNHIEEILGLPRAPKAEVIDDQAAGGTSDRDAEDGASNAGAGPGGGGGQADAGNAGGDQGQGADATGAGSGDAGGDSGQGNQGAGTGDQGVKSPASPASAEKPVAPAAAVNPDDYKLEVEDAQGNKFTISDIDELPDDFTPKNNKQALQILDNLHELKSKRTADEAVAAGKAEQTRIQGEQAAVQKGWMTEIDALQADGRIEKPKIKEGQPGFLEDPAVKRMDEVFQFMLDENKGRITKGIAPIRSFTDALTHLELKEARAQKVTADKTLADIAKRKAGMLNGAGGAGNSGGVPDRPYVAGQAQDIFDVINQ